MTSSVSSVISDDKSARREARLLDAATLLFARFGFDKTSIDEIAREAGVSKGAVYLHWPSKDALFEATLIREWLRFLDDVHARIDADALGGTLAGIYRHSILALDGSPLLMALLTFDARVLGDYVRRQDPSVSTRRFLFGEEFVRRMQAAGLMRADLEPRITAHVMSVISFGLLSLGQIAPGIAVPSLQSLAEGLADLLDRGLATHDVEHQSADAGKRAFRTLTDESKRLVIERSEAISGSHDRTRTQG